MFNTQTYKSIGVFTAQGSRFRALNFIKALINPMFVLGKTTPWNTLDEPPPPSQTISMIQEPLIYLRPTLIDILDYDYCGSDSSYLDAYKDYHPSLFPTKTTDVGKVLIVTHVPKALITTPFRSMALVSGVELVPGIPYESYYEPQHITSTEVIHWISYFTPTNWLQGGPHTLSIVIDC